MVVVRCALFMAPPVLAKLSRATGDRKYLDFMDHEWWITSSLLYSPSNHLFFRDKSYLDKHEANGSSIFWSRGNGWVFAGLARVLAEMPQDYPSRAKYVAQFKEMAEEIAVAAGRGRALEAGTAGCGGLSASGELRLRLFYLRLCLWNQLRHSGSRQIPARGPESLAGAAVAHLPGWQAGMHPADRRGSGRLHCCLKLCFRYRRFSARGLRGLPPGAMS